MLIRFGCLILLILTCGVFSSTSAKAQDCGALFKPEKKWSSIALDYAPTLDLPQGPQTFPNSVLIEVEDVLSGDLLRQYLFPYIDPISHLMYPFGKNLFHEVGLKAIYQNYGSRVDSKIIEIVRDVESTLTLDRQSTLLVTDVNRGNGADAVGGFVRIVDGSITHLGFKRPRDLRCR